MVKVVCILTNQQQAAWYGGDVMPTNLVKTCYEPIYRNTRFIRIFTCSKK